jgi:hypothetical protein
MVSRHGDVLGNTVKLGLLLVKSDKHQFRWPAHERLIAVWLIGVQPTQCSAVRGPDTQYPGHKVVTGLSDPVDPQPCVTEGVEQLG